VFSHFSGHEEGFIIDIALNDGLNIQIDKPPSYHGRNASFVSPWHILIVVYGFSLDFCDAVCVIGNVAIGLPC